MSLFLAGIMTRPLCRARRGADHVDHRRGHAFKSAAQRPNRKLSGSALLPLINKDFPALDALRFENALLEPGVVFHSLAHFIFISSVKEEKGAAFIDQRPAHPDETFRHKSINERGVLVPQRLLPRALRNIAIGTG